MRSFLTAVALLTVLALSGRARAYDYNLCDGTKIVWQGQDKLFRNTFSIPNQGIAQSSYLNAIDRWNAVAGMGDVFKDAGTTSGSAPLTHGDGQSDVFLVDPAAIGNVAGLTYKFFTACNIFSDSTIAESDVMIANNQDFTTTPDEATVFLPARTTFLHEFGHALGLNHFEDYNIMRAVGPSPFFGGAGEHVDVLPDDAAGGRFLYPSGFNQWNVFASAQLRNTSNNTISNNTGVGPVYSCSGGGGQITILATVGNNGTVNIQQTERWYLSTNKLAYGGVIFYQWNNSTYLANSALTIQRTMTMPALPVGTYFLFHGVDSLFQFSESREDDNVAREALIVKVIQC